MAGTPDSSPPVNRGDRRPPYSEEAEKGVLGSVLQDARILDLCVESQLLPESFYVPAHRIVYEVLLDLSVRARPIDLLTVANQLRDNGTLDKIGGEVTLHRLIDSTPTTAHSRYYIDIVRQKHVLRNVIECARNAESECYSTDEDAFSLLGRVEESFFSITDQHRGPTVSWSDTVKTVMEQVERAKLGEGGTGTVHVGFTDLDRCMGGMRPGNMVILAARPSMGKTSLAMNMVENITRGHTPGGEPAPVGVFSLEMSCDDLAMRMLCTYAKVSMHRVRQGYISGGDEHRRLVEAADVLGKAPVYLDDTPGLDITELRARARRMRQKHEVKLIVVDYLQLLHSREFTRQGRQIETGAISAGLKGLAKELNLPVLVLSQLSRAPESRDSGVPRLSDLRDSGSIEQDADMVLLLRRPSRIHDDKEHDDRRLAILDVAKNRNGPTQDGIRMNFDEEFTRFEDRAEDHGVDEFGPADYEEVLAE